MSRLIVLFLPSSTNMDWIRSVLGDQFQMNERIEGLGELEELDLYDNGCHFVKFEYGPDAETFTASGTLRSRDVSMEGLHGFYLQVPGSKIHWRLFNRMVAVLAAKTNLWLSSERGAVMSGNEYSAAVARDGDFDF